MEKAVFRSKLGIALWSVLWLIIAIAFYISLKSMSLNSSDPISIILAVTWVLTFALLLTVMLGTRYIIDGGELIIKIGPITERKIRVEKIITISRSYNMISSPANSLKRLEIVYSGGQVLISPSREKEFLDLLESISSEIDIKDLN